MEKNQKLLIAGLFLAGFGIAAYLVKNGNFNLSEGDRIRQEASLATPSIEKPVLTGQSISEIAKSNPEPQKPASPATTIKFEEESFDFGMTNEGSHVVHVFKFKNTGTEPLIISNARGSCGCTIPTWPKDPVAPGATGEIKVDFDTAGKPGNQSKRITVVANTNPTETYLTIQGIVRGKDQTPTAKGK